MTTKILCAVVSALLAGFGGMGISTQEELLTFVQKEADWVSFHIWVPVEALQGQIPSQLNPAHVVFDPAEPSPPVAMTDAYLFIRSGTYEIPISGKRVEEEIIDSFLAVAVKPGAALANDRSFDLYLIEYYSDTQIFNTLLRQEGIEAKLLEGSYESTTLPNNNEMAELSISASNYKKWDLLVRSTDFHHYEFNRSLIRLFYSVAEELRLLEISIAEDFYYRAASQLDDFKDNNPFDRWSDWRWAEKDSLIFFTRDSVHKITK